MTTGLLRSLSLTGIQGPQGADGAQGADSTVPGPQGAQGTDGFQGPQGPQGTDAAGDIVGPTSATDNAVARFDGTTGKLLQNSGVTIDDSGNLNLSALASVFKINANDILGFRLNTTNIVLGGGGGSLSGLDQGNFFAGTDCGTAIKGTGNIGLGSYIFNYGGALADTYTCLALGAGAFGSVDGAIDCIGIGQNSGVALVNGRENVFIGGGTFGSGATIVSGNGNICIGANAGPSSGDPSDSLYINRVQSNTPLIYGLFTGTGAGVKIHSQNTAGVPLIAKGIAAQASNLFQCQKSDATVVFSVDKDGNLQTNSKFSEFNNIATEDYGVPAIVDGVHLAAQTADIAATNFMNAGVAGNYEVTYYLQDVVADATAGILTLTIAWTDDAGATTVAVTQVLTTLGRVYGSLPVRLASGNITYAVTHTGIFGTATYRLDLQCKRTN